MDAFLPSRPKGLETAKKSYRPLKIPTEKKPLKKNIVFALCLQKLHTEEWDSLGAKLAQNEGTVRCIP